MDAILEIRADRALCFAAHLAAEAAVHAAFDAIGACRLAIKRAGECVLDGALAVVGGVALAGLHAAQATAELALNAAKLALAAPRLAFEAALKVWEGIKAGVGLALKFIGDALAGLAGVGSFLLNAIKGSIKVSGACQELHLHARFAFFGVKFSIKVDIDFAEIDDFIEALVHKIIEVVYQKIASFGVKLDFGASFTLGGFSVSGGASLSIGAH